jgi:hypothetical protein
MGNWGNFLGNFFKKLKVFEFFYKKPRSARVSKKPEAFRLQKRSPQILMNCGPC